MLLVLPVLLVAPPTFADKKNRPLQTVRTLMVLGDSLSAGYGIGDAESWVDILKRRLASSYYHINVINASISGETTLGGLNRLSNLLVQHNPQIVILELGGNDGLQGLPLAHMKDNLERMIKILKRRNIKTVFVGMKLPPNYGKFYTKEFHKVFSHLANKYKLAYLPFLLTKIAKKKKYMQDDGIHPRANAQMQILSNVWPQIRRVLPKANLK